jgi:potassium-transporting ATPase potassium-binding subunit
MAREVLGQEIHGDAKQTEKYCVRAKTGDVMTVNGWIQILLFAAIIFAITKPLGSYMYRVFEGDRQPLPRLFGAIERLLYKLCGVDPKQHQDWKQYTVGMLVFSALTLLLTYGIERLQHVLPLNPQNFPPVAEDLAFNTAASFTTNTNWQAYTGESTMSYFTQMAGLAWHNFISAAVGIGIALALARGITYRLHPTAPKAIGNFWVDLIRSIVYVLLPISIPVALVLVSQGVIQNLSSYVEVTTLEGAKQTLAMGPVVSQEIIKELGTNGGGFFNANSAHPFESPTPLTNFIELLLIFSIPAAITYTYGRMARDQKQGWVLFAAMALIFFVGVSVAYYSEAQGNPLMRGMAVDQGAGNWEGKEARFGIANSALFATVTTATSCGAVNSMHDSFTALGGLVPLANIQLGELVFGGVGAGLYAMLIYVILSVFIAGLMVGRTPEYLGKKIESREIKLSMLYVLIFPLLILYYAGWSLVAPYGVSSLNNAGPHGLSEILYAYSSAAGNNGSAFAGLNANTPWYNASLGLTMLAGRFLMIVPAMAIAGSLVGKKAVPVSLGTFPTNGSLFVVLLVGVIIIVGALTFFPALALGPIVEHFLAQAGKVY